MSRILKMMVAGAAMVASLAVPTQAGQGDYTLIVAPARFSVIQMSFDLIKKRPAVLVSYRGEASTPEPLIYAWNGTEWVYVSLQDFRDVRFLQDSPKQVVLLGDENTIPKVLKEAAGWAKDPKTVKELDNASLVNEFGRLFNWSSDEWSWFASRYNLKLQDEAEPYRHSSWYDQPGPLKRDDSKNVGAPPAFEPSVPADATHPAEMPPVKVQETPAKTAPATLPAAATITITPAGNVSERARSPEPTVTPKP